MDPLTWEIKLRSGVRFHNGAVMDAEAVKASLERTIRLSTASADALGIDTIVANDDQTITITTLEPRPTMPGLLTTPAVAITDAAAADAAGEGNFIMAGALTGPYIPTEYIQKERLSSVANDNYWGGVPPLSGIEHVAIPDTNSRELALQAGDIDIAVNISPEGAQAINVHPEMRSSTAGFGTAVVMWWVNFERPALSDPLVRRAVSLAIDRESIAGLVAPEGTGSYAELLLPEALVSCPGVSAPGYDPEQARELLAQAGYVDTDGDGIVDKDGQPLEIVIGGYPQRFQLPIMAEAAQAMLDDVGIKAEVLITEWSVVKEPGWDLFGWYNNVVDTGDPILNISKFVGVSADASGSGANNYGHFHHTELETIISSAAGRFGHPATPGNSLQRAGHRGLGNGAPAGGPRLPGVWGQRTGCRVRSPSHQSLFLRPPHWLERVIGCGSFGWILDTSARTNRFRRHPSAADPVARLRDHPCLTMGQG